MGDGENGASGRDPASHEYVYARLERLYEASKRLATFENIDETLPAVLEVVTQTLPLATAILVVKLEDRDRTFVWSAEKRGEDQVRDARVHAQEAFEYFIEDHEGAETANSAVQTRRMPGARMAAPVATARPFVVLPIALPLVSKERRIFGIFQLEVATALETPDLLFVDALVNQLAIAIDRYRAKMAEHASRLEAERSANRVRQLMRVWEPLLEALTLDEILPSVLQRIREMLATDAAVLLLLDPDESVLRVRAHIGLERAVAVPIRVGTGIAGRIVADGGPMIFNDVLAVPAVNPLLRDNGIRSLVGVPLRVHGRITGVLEACSATSREFVEEDAQLLEIAADRVAFGIEHARLFDRERQFTTKLQTISDEAVKIADSVEQSSADRAVLLRTIVEASRAVTGADYAALGIGVDPGQPFDPWVFSAASDERAATVGPAPRPVGLLGLVPNGAASCRLADLRQHSAFAGGPTDYRDMGPFLGVPVKHRLHVIGSLYLFKDAHREPFTEEDQRTIELLSAHAGVAMENVRLYDAARDAAHSRELMTAVVSHDLRNPLGAIRMRAELLLHSAEALGERPGAWRQQVEGIKRQADRTLRLIRDLLDVASIEAGQISIAKQPTPLRALAEDVLEDFEAAADEKSIRLEKLLPGADFVVSCDRDRVGQALSNLMSNALKFTGRGGRVTVRVDRLGTDARFTVEDTGCGIPDAHLPHVFDRYWQPKGSASRLGIGLGLSIAKAVVEAHGGRIWVSSTLGVGTVFGFTLPAGASADEQPTAPSASV